MSLTFARPRVIPALVAVGFFAVVAAVTLGVPELSTAPDDFVITTADIGNAFFDEFLAVFEIVAVLLVAALVGAVYLAVPEKTRRDAVRKAVEAKPRVTVEDDSGTRTGAETGVVADTDTDTDTQTKDDTETETGASEEEEEDREGDNEADEEDDEDEEVR